MKNVVLFLCFLWLIPLEGIARERVCASPFDLKKDYFPDHTDLKYARGFRVTYFRNYKIIEVFSPWKGAKRGFSYLAIQCGAPVPDKYAHLKRVVLPLKRVVSMSVTQLGLLDQLGVVDRLVGVAKGKVIHTASVRLKFQQGEITEVGSYANVNMEVMAMLQPDLVISFAVGNRSYDDYFKIEKIGIPVAVVAEYMEENPLGRSEWIKFLAAFFNKEKEAAKIFNQKESQYLKYTRLTQQIKHRPKVLVNRTFKGIWYIPANNSYIAQLIHDAGGKYYWENLEGQGSYPLEFEAVLARAWDADVWINPGNKDSLRSLLQADERNEKFQAFQKGKVFNHNAVVNEYGGNDYWEGGMANPHLVLADLIHVFHPEILPAHQLIWYQRLR